MEKHSCSRFFTVNYCQNAEPNSGWTSFVYVAEDFIILYCPDYHPGREPDWVDLTLRGTMDVIKEGILLGRVPNFVFA